MSDDELFGMFDTEHVLKVYVDKRRYGKSMTVIEGIAVKDGVGLAKILKRRTATGGTAKDGKVELQGDQRTKVKKILEEMGFKVELK